MADRSRVVIFRYRSSPRSRADFADEPIAAFAHMAGAATAHTGLLDDRWRPVVVHRKPFSEHHVKIPWLNNCKSSLDSIGAA
jgi:hypothetical protein